MNNVVVLLVFTAALALSSCGSGTTVAPNCATVVLTVQPANGSADHLATASSNSVQFNAVEQYASENPSQSCAIPNVVLGVTDAATWSVSDAVNVRISNAAGSQGMATCVGSTNRPVTITANAPENLDTMPSKVLTATATLTCQ